MTNVNAKLRSKGKSFEILVDIDKAMQLKKGMAVSIDNVLAFNEVYSDIKKGIKCSTNDMQEHFGTADIRVIAEKIIKNGEIEVPAEYRKKEQENKIKQVVDFLARNAVDPSTGRPHTANRIESALKDAGVNIDNKPVEQQIAGILAKLKPIIPIKIENKKIKIIVPAMHTGKAYGLFKDYKEKE